MPGVLLVGSTSAGALVPILVNADGSLAGVGGGGGGGGSTDVSALNKETTQQSILTAFGSLATAGKQDTIATALGSSGALALGSKQDTIITALGSGGILATASKQDILHTDLGSILAKLIAAPASDATFAQSQSLSNSLGALNASVALTPGRKGTAIVQVTGTFVGTLSLQGNLDGTNYVNFTATPQFLNMNTGAYTATITGPGVYQTSMNGLVNAKITMTAFTSGAAIVSVTLTDAPSMVALDASIPAGSAMIGAVTLAASTIGNSLGTVRVGDGTNAAAIKAASTSPATTDASLVVALSPNSGLGAVPVTSINAATGVATGTALDNISTRKSHTMQVDVTTTVAGTTGNHTVLLEGSLDNTWYFPIGTVTLAATSTTAADTTNHGNISVANTPYRFIRARSTSVPTTWTGTVTAKVTSGV